MIYVQSTAKIVDNSGGFYCLIIRILTNSKLSQPGDTLVISVKSVIFNKKVLFQKKRKVFKGEIRKAVLLRSANIKKRNFLYFKPSTNAVALIGRWDMPIGNRIFGPVMFEVRTTPYLKIAMLSEGVF